MICLSRKHQIEGRRWTLSWIRSCLKRKQPATQDESFINGDWSINGHTVAGFEGSGKKIAKAFKTTSSTTASCNGNAFYEAMPQWSCRISAAVTYIICICYWWQEYDPIFSSRVELANIKNVKWHKPVTSLIINMSKITKYGVECCSYSTMLKGTKLSLNIKHVTYNMNCHP